MTVVLQSLIATKEMMWEDVARPLAEFIIMFINNEGLLQYKELERTGGHSEITDPSQAAAKDQIFGVTQDEGGNIDLKSGKQVNIVELMKQVDGLEKAGKGKKL
jgi:hypothetical protein